jgi:hypothetical protein
LAAAQVIHTEEVEKRAQELNSANDSRLHLTLVSSPVEPTFAVRVCPSPPAARLVVSADGGSVPGGAVPGGLSGGMGSADEGQGVDIAPTTTALLARANAKLIYWQNFYATCKAEGACR